MGPNSNTGWHYKRDASQVSCDIRRQVVRAVLARGHSDDRTETNEPRIIATLRGAPFEGDLAVGHRTSQMPSSRKGVRTSRGRHPGNRAFSRCSPRLRSKRSALLGANLAA